MGHEPNYLYLETPCRDEVPLYIHYSKPFQEETIYPNDWRLITFTVASIVDDLPNLIWCVNSYLDVTVYCNKLRVMTAFRNNVTHQKMGFKSPSTREGSIAWHSLGLQWALNKYT